MDKALDEMAKVKSNQNQKDGKSSRKEDDRSSCEEDMQNCPSTSETYPETEDEDFKTPCPWQTGKEDCECSEVMTDELIPFQLDGNHRV